MPQVDYSKIVIYKIQHQSKDELLYVGSTTHFGNRKRQHKQNCYNVNGKPYNYKLYKTIRDNGGWDMFNMVIVKEYPCENKRQAEAEEDKCIREMKSSLNTHRAFTTPEERREHNKEYRVKNKNKIKEKHKEYREQNKDKLKERNKEHYEQNKDKMNELKKEYYLNNKDKISKQRKEYREQNKDKIKEHYEQNKDKIREQRKEYLKEYYRQNRDKIKEHYEQNKDKISVQSKEYSEKNKGKIKEYQKEYRQKNRDKKKEYQKEYYRQNRDKFKEEISCVCGCVLTESYLAKHLKTKKHQTFINQQTEQ